MHLQKNNGECDVFIQPIPRDIYQEAVNFLCSEYRFLNGVENAGRCRLANYFVGIKSSLANQFVDFINEIIGLDQNGKFPKVTLPEGFDSHKKTITAFEANGGFSFGSFDMAVTERGLKNIEFQAIATYPFTSSRLNLFIQEQLRKKDSYIFADSKHTSWNDFLEIYRTILCGANRENIVLIDRSISHQKTSFEFYATQKELGLPVEIVDIKDITEKNQRLFFKKSSNKEQGVHRIYNRILPSEAIYDDDYPNSKKWQLRYDQSYKDLVFINHPRKLFEISKRLLPYVEHSFNPTALELIDAAPLFLNNTLAFSDFVWKHKVGAAGFRLILSPSKKILKKLIGENSLLDYIAQRKVEYKIFKTDDGQEKIVELRFMTAHSNDQINIIPIARIGHYIENKNNTRTYKIHLSDNNVLGYGLAPTLIF